MLNRLKKKIDEGIVKTWNFMVAEWKILSAILVIAIVVVTGIYILYLLKLHVFDPISIRVNNTSPKVFIWMPIGGVILVILALVVRSMRTRGFDLRDIFTRENWEYLKENEGPLVLGTVLFLILPFFFGYLGYPEVPGKWFWVVFSPLGLFLIIGIAAFGAMKRHDKNNPFKHKLGTIGVWVFGIVAVCLILVKFGYWDKLKFEPRAASAETLVKTGRLGRAETQDEVITFWKKNLPLQDAREMINITFCESKFNHWDENGNILTGMNKNGSTDYGVSQINSVWIPEAEELGYNIETLADNLRMALHIRNKKGATEWSCYEEVTETSEKVTPLTAPTQPEWSPVYKVKNNCMWEVDSLTLIKDENGKIHKLYPNKDVNVITLTFQISVPEGEEPGTMRYRCS